MKYLFTVTAEVEIEAENVAQAHKQAKRLDLISRFKPSQDRFMVSGASRSQKDRDSVHYSVRQKSLKVRLEGIT